MNDISTRDVAQRGAAFVNRRLNERKATTIAQEIGWTDSALSKFRSEDLDRALLLIAACGGKVVPADSHCLKRVDYEFLTRKVEQQMKVAGPDFWAEDVE